jgi:hypothetical protein
VSEIAEYMRAAVEAQREIARLRARLAEVEGAAAEWERKAAVVSEGPPSMETLFRGAIKATYAECAAALRAVLSRTEGRAPTATEPETGCGGPKEACIPCRKPRDHEAYRCTECGVTWCDECSCPAPTHDGGGTPPREETR